MHAALLRREFSARDLLGSTLAAIERLNPALNAIVQKDAASAWRAASESDSRIARGEARPLEGALWLDEPYAPVDATVAAALRKAALMLEEAGAIVDESARPAFSFEEAWEVFAVLTHALSGAGPPDKVRDKWAAREHDFLTSDLSHRALQARGMRLSTPVSSAFGLGGNAFARSGHGFSNISTSCFARLPLRGPSGTINSQIRMRDQSRSMANKGLIST